MKKILLFFMMVLCAGSVLATGSTGTITGRTTLSNGYIYTVPSSVTINATNSAAGLTVADKAVVTIYIPKGVTLTVNGSGRMAGIYIPSTSTLIITGEGTLSATSGKPSYGGAGTSGGSAYFSGDYAYVGGGGTGGAGGNGAGAAIGGNGGVGGSAVSGPGSSRYLCDKKAYYGPASYTGNNGGNGSTMGTMYVMGTVTVNASLAFGINGSSPSSGGWGSQVSYTWSNTYFAGGGGPGGNGGQGSYMSSAIGGGGYGGGSGASGAAGGLSWHGQGNSNYKNCFGSSGGNGAGAGQNRSYGSRTGKATQGEGSDVRWGGASAYGGNAGSNGGNGTVYKLTATNNDPTISGAAATTNTTSYPSQVQATLSFNTNKGTGAEANRTVYYGVKMDNVTIPTRGDASGSYEFLGYYTAATGGTPVFNADGTPVSVSTIAANTTLYAHWKGTKFTFMNGTDEVKTTTFVTIPGLLDNSYTANPGTRPHPYFCGYYTASGIQVFDHNLNFKASSIAFGETETLYAQFISTQHTVVWDYSYRSDENAYNNVDTHVRYCRLQFKRANGTVFKTVYIEAPEVQNKTASEINNNIATHTTSQVVVDLLIGNTTDDVVTGSNAQIHFTQAELEGMRGYQFDAWTTNNDQGAKPQYWATNTNPTDHKTIFNFKKLGENMFWLKWSVTLKDLNLYPYKIYVKPMILVNGNYQEIDQMSEVLGEECYDPHDGRAATGQGTSVTYSGEFPVLINQNGTPANYKIGMVGFYLAGSNYFMNVNQGQVAPDLISETNVSYTTQVANEEKTLTINDTINDYDIPVVLLLPANPTAGVTDAHINHLNQILYVDQARAGKVSLSNFVAQRPHFNFAGWYDAEMTAEIGQDKVWGANEYYYFYTHTQPYGGTRTLIALWARDTKPEASIAMEQDDENKQYTYTVTATDEVAVKSVRYLIADGDAKVTSATQGWSEPLTLTDGKYSFSIPFANEYFGKYVYVLVENEGNYTIVRDAEYIRSYLYLTANPDPETANGTLVENGTDEKGNTIYKFVADGTYRDYYSTYYHSLEAYKLHDVVAYMVKSVKSVNESASMLNLVQIKPNAHGEYILPKDEPVILKGTTPTFTLERILSDAENDRENILDGTDEPKTISNSEVDNYYILSYAQYGLGFYHPASLTLAAHKAYIELNRIDNIGPVAPRAFNFNFYGPDTDNPIMTDIENVEEPEANEVVNGPVYDIYGHVVAPSLDQAGHLANGLYIVGGKKVVINK